MPWYEYECEQGHRSEIRVSLMGRPNQIKCPTCGHQAQRVYSNVNAIVKGGTPKFHHEPGKGK